MRASIDKTPRYNLNVVLRETGVKADTLRSWERRHHLPRPERSKGGHRLFSDYDIETVKWMLSRQAEGMSIGRAAALWNEIEAGGNDPLASGGQGLIQEPVVVTTAKAGERITALRGEWLRACLAFNEEAAEQVLGEAFALFAMETVCTEILQKGLAEVGERWYMGEVSVQQEHFTAELAIRRLHALMAAAPAPVHDQAVIVGCPPGEMHTFPALYSTLMLRYRGWPVIYLGANVPIERLHEVVGTVKPGLVVLSALRLVTAATLLDCGREIETMGARLAFGGGVFSQIPGLETRIPGYFLGNQMRDSVINIEGLLGETFPTKAVKVALNDHSELIEMMIANQHTIEANVLEGIKAQYGAVIPEEYFSEANEFLREDILAALKLGEIRLADHNLVWIEGLLGRHAYHREALDTYLTAYSEAVEEHLREVGKPITNWLEDVLNGKRRNNGDER